MELQLGVHVKGFEQASFHDRLLMNSDPRAELRDVTRLVKARYDAWLEDTIRRAAVANMHWEHACETVGA